MPSYLKTLKDKNVSLIDTSRFTLKCNACERTWSPNMGKGGRLPRGYWKCTEGCDQLGVKLEVDPRWKGALKKKRYNGPLKKGY